MAFLLVESFGPTQLPPVVSPYLRWTVFICFLVLIREGLRVVRSIINAYRILSGTAGRSESTPPQATMNGPVFCFLWGVLNACLQSQAILKDVVTKGPMDDGRMMAACMGDALAPIIWGTSMALVILVVRGLGQTVVRRLFTGRGIHRQS